MIVDDEPQILRLLTAVLTRAGHEIHTSDSTRDAFQLCISPAAFDLVLSNVDMPGVTGHDLARWLAARHPAIRVMLMSAFDSDCNECPYLERCVLIRKPFAPGEVVKQVTAALAN